ncbi:hypothetical protein B0H63DRAFT_224027 [Podospora didyma]|uniref:G-patch domain-containing protein n=1 Tax=Podospora didyma TaxID=330526 RepID=A0AAE0KJB5_9PEZI|nr:hypothetical protein B0H63DRAFT_224027 [Podospora didyma]
MAAPPPPPQRGSLGGLSLYANLLDSGGDGSAASISRDPVVFNKQGGENNTPAKKPIDPALLLQPIRRPQAKQSNSSSKPKATFFPKAPTAAPPTPASTGDSNAPAVQQQQQQRSTLADWAATGEEELAAAAAAAAEKRARGGRSNKKKKNNQRPVETDWDEIYDPERPTNVQEYLNSDERIRELREWKDILYADPSLRRGSDSASYSSSNEDTDDSRGRSRRRTGQFAPPASFSFAPPPLSPPPRPSVAPAAAAVLEAASGDDAYTRRLALSGIPPPPLPPPEPPAAGGTISRAPVRYEVSPPPEQPSNPEVDEAMDLDSPASDKEEVDYDSILIPPPSSTDPEAAPSRRPGQSGFAQRHMSKYGWTKGSGLGADESGITSALRVQIEKRRKRPDSEGGGFIDPKGGRGKIIAAKSNAPKSDNDGSKFGQMSEVIVLQNMLEGMPNLVEEIEAGLQQEIGEECGEKYGRVERIFIDLEGRQVFIKFTETVSALRVRFVSLCSFPSVSYPFRSLPAPDNKIQTTSALHPLSSI